MLNRTKVLAGSAAAVGAVALLIGPIGAAAQEDDDPTETTTAPDAATDEETPEAGATWLEEALAPLVESGTLTQAQADAVATALEEARPAPGERGGRGHRGGPMGHWGDGLQAAATAIGIDEETLRLGPRGPDARRGRRGQRRRSAGRDRRAGDQRRRAHRRGARRRPHRRG